MHQSLQGATFHIEHVKPRSQGGGSDFENLALCCPACNLHKAARTHLTDPESGSVVAVYNPREQLWSEHFTWEKFQLVGLTAVGRALIDALQLNHTRKIDIRRAEETFGLFPPPNRK